MKPRRLAGMTCPRCHQFCYRMTGDRLSEHRTDSLAIGSRRRERCAYSGGLIVDAEQSITPIRRRRLDRESVAPPLDTDQDGERGQDMRKTCDATVLRYEERSDSSLHHCIKDERHPGRHSDGERAW